MIKFVMDKLPTIGFLIFVYGVMFLVIGNDISAFHDVVTGGVLAALGFFLFIYGNMLEDEKQNG